MIEFKLKIVKLLAIYVFLFGFLAIFYVGCASSRKQFNQYKGLSFVASPKELSESAVIDITEVGANAVSLMPFCYMPKSSEPELIYTMKNQWWGETVEGCRTTIQWCHNREIKVMLKPQIWCGSGTFTGYIEMKSEKDWLAWENNYRSFIMKFAELARSEGVELFCIGTELAKTVELRPQFWLDLIHEIRSIYKGKLTYAENWDSFDQPAFLKKLDFIGVDAYFPLSEKRNPTKEDLTEGWKPYVEKLKKCSETIGKKILFTEWGYRNIDYAAVKPWDYTEENVVRNDTLQSLLYTVTFEEVFTKDFIAGGFLWKWFPKSMLEGGETGTQFSPQGKPAEKVVKKYFRK
ncbi:MAG: glycoside hydrolase [Bacteroidetes bacterium]|nr:glycoside hydrolase [Bacteroidota bacterium]